MGACDRNADLGSGFDPAPPPSCTNSSPPSLRWLLARLAILSTPPAPVVCLSTGRASWGSSPGILRWIWSLAIVASGDYATGTPLLLCGLAQKKTICGAKQRTGVDTALGSGDRLCCGQLMPLPQRCPCNPWIW